MIPEEETTQEPQTEEPASDPPAKAAETAQTPPETPVEPPRAEPTAEAPPGEASADTPPAAAQENPAAGASTAAAGAPAPEQRPSGDAPRGEGRPRFEGPRGERSERGDRRPRRFGRRRVCAFCVEKVRVIDYKDPIKLRRFLSDRARIEPRRKTGTCAKHQRRLCIALKRARHLALLPYTQEHIRLTGVFASRR